MYSSMGLMDGDFSPFAYNTHTHIYVDTLHNIIIKYNPELEESMMCIFFHVSHRKTLKFDRLRREFLNIVQHYIHSIQKKK